MRARLCWSLPVSCWSTSWWQRACLIRDSIKPRRPSMDAVTDRMSTRFWPAGLTRVPYWVYADADVLAAEQKRIFEGPVWNYLCLEIELPNVGDYRTTFIGNMPVVVARAEDGGLCAFENRC